MKTKKKEILLKRLIFLITQNLFNIFQNIENIPQLDSIKTITEISLKKKNKNSQSVFRIDTHTQTNSLHHNSTNSTRRKDKKKGKKNRSITTKYLKKRKLKNPT